MPNNFIQANWNAPKNIKTLVTTINIPLESHSRLDPEPTPSAPLNAKTYNAINIIPQTVVPEQSQIHHATNRKQQKTESIFFGFNLATHVNDDINVVMHNRKILNQFLPSAPHWLLQTHSNNVLAIDSLNQQYLSPSSQLPTMSSTLRRKSTPLKSSDIKINKESHEYQNYDAAITFTKNKVCVVLTADCIPILLTDTLGSFVAAIHAGRVGIAKNIIKHTINKASVTSNKILAYIAPAICQKHYEVGSDILDEFKQLDHRYPKFFQEKAIPNKFDLDLNGIAALQLLDAGLLLNNIYQSGICTYCHSDTFYSYRKNKNSGRFASLIWIA